MSEDWNGVSIVAGLAGGRPWWTLTAGNVQPWVSSLHHSAVQDHISRTEWIGDAWDGSSDVQVGDSVVAGQHVRLLLTTLEEGLASMGDVGVAAPDASSVRQCFAGSGAVQTLAVDFDFGEFILPLGIPEWSLGLETPEDVGIMAARMLDLISYADARRQALETRDLRMRRAFEETVRRIGHGVAPLWLRLDPLRVGDGPSSMLHSPYVMIMVTLNECLEWSPSGDQGPATVADVRSYYGYVQRLQRSRAAAAARLAAEGSAGSIDTIALALIDEHGLSPSEVFAQARALALADRRAGVTFRRGDREETIFYRDGTLDTMLPFEGGIYVAGTLSLWGDFPATLGAAVGRRTLERYVDHPAFVAARPVVTRVVVEPGALRVSHRKVAVSVEEADRARSLASTQASAPAA